MAGRIQISGDPDCLEACDSFIQQPQVYQLTGAGFSLHCSLPPSVAETERSKDKVDGSFLVERGVWGAVLREFLGHDCIW